MQPWSDDNCRSMTTPPGSWVKAGADLHFRNDRIQKAELIRFYSPFQPPFWAILSMDTNMENVFSRLVGGFTPIQKSESQSNLQHHHQVLEDKKLC